MNESLPPEGRRVSYKSLDSEAMAAARRAAEAAGISLQEWLSRTILENARRSGIVPDAPSREVTAAQPNAEEAVQAIARHLERAKAAADAQGLSLAEWLSRAILSNAAGSDSRRPAAEPATLPAPSAAGTETPPAEPKAEELPPPLPAPKEGPPRSRSRVLAQAQPEDVPLPDASTVRDVLARAGARAAAMTPEAEGSRRRRSIALWAALGIVVVIGIAVGVVPNMRTQTEGPPETAAPTAEPPRTETAALPGEARPPEPAPQPPAGNPPNVAKAPEAAKPPASTPPSSTEAKPSEPKSAAPKAAEAKPPAPKAPESKPAEKAAPESADAELAKVPAKDMPKPASAHVDWYKKAAEAENAEAQYALAELYLKGDGVPRSFPNAAQLFRRAAEKGNLSRAQYALGLLYQRGLGVPKSDVDAVLWWQKAADQSFMPAITWVGLSLLEGRGIPKDEEAARKMLERAAEGDEPNAQYTLGRIFERGIGTKKDPVLAMKWFILAAEQAHKEATQKVEELSTSLPRELQERATELVSEHYRRFRKRG